MWLELLKSSLDEDFGEKLKQTISGLGMNIKQFSEESGIPESTLYKIISRERTDFRVSTLGKIVKVVKKLEGYEEENIVGIITSRGALDLVKKEMEFDGKKVKVKELPATTIEEEIIQGVKAEREGIRGIVCGPLAATTLEKVVDIPISSLRFEEGPLESSIQRLAEKI